MSKIKEIGQPEYYLYGYLCKKELGDLDAYFLGAFAVEEFVFNFAINVLSLNWFDYAVLTVVER